MANIRFHNCGESKSYFYSDVKIMPTRRTPSIFTECQGTEGFAHHPTHLYKSYTCTYISKCES